MAFRDELSAAQARADALQQRVSELEAENAGLRDPGDASEPEVRSGRRLTVSLVAGTIGPVAVLIGAGVIGLNTGRAPVAAVCFSLAAMIVVGVAVSISLIEVVPPGFVLVLSGRNRVVANGQTVGYRIVGAGRTMRLPIVERVDRLDVRPHPIGVSVRGAYCKDNVPLAVDATAIIEIASHEPAVNAAVERFLGRSLAEVDRVASETLEGAMRAVVSRLTPAELRTDTARFAHYLTEEAEDDLARLGIALDSLHIERVSGD